MLGFARELWDAGGELQEAGHGAVGRVRLDADCGEIGVDVGERGALALIEHGAGDDQPPCRVEVVGAAQRERGLDGAVLRDTSW